MTTTTTKKETTMNTSLHTPYAVYGTLRSGCGNDALWHGIATAELDGTVDGYRLTSGGGFPYAIPADGERIRVELIVPTEDAELAVELRRRLDRLEGYPLFYDRVPVEVQTIRGAVIAWLYTPARPERHASLPSVPGNDWLQRHGAREETWQGS